VDSARRSGAPGTPAFYLNGELLEGLPPADAPELAGSSRG